MSREERKLYESFFKKVVIEHIREARLEKGWTQAKLAEEIDVSHEFILALESEKGKDTFSAFTVWRIAKALEVDLNVLLDFDMEAFRTTIEKAMQVKHNA